MLELMEKKKIKKQANKELHNYNLGFVSNLW